MGLLQTIRYIFDTTTPTIEDLQDTLTLNPLEEFAPRTASQGPGDQEVRDNPLEEFAPRAAGQGPLSSSSVSASGMAGLTYALKYESNVEDRQDDNYIFPVTPGEHYRVRFDDGTEVEARPGDTFFNHPTRKKNHPMSNPYPPVPGGALNPINWLLDLADETAGAFGELFEE